MHSGAIQSARQGLHSLKKKKKGVAHCKGFSIPESGKCLLVESRIWENFACGIRNLGKLCLWIPESGKILLVESGIWENFACRIRNLRNFWLSWNPESWALEFGIQLKESGNPLTKTPDSVTMAVLDSLIWSKKF